VIVGVVAAVADQVLPQRMGVVVAMKKVDLLNNPAYHPHLPSKTVNAEWSQDEVLPFSIFLPMQCPSWIT
jgi:hypothetical protein